MTVFSLSNLEQSIARKYKALSPGMDERGRRLWAAAEMREIGYGGDEEMTALNIEGEAFHPEWNYIISPQIV